MPASKAQCQHIKENGEQCKKHALPGRNYCSLKSHRRAALWRTRTKIFVQKWWPIIAACLTLAGVAPILYSYATRITVTQDRSIRSHEPMGTIFNVTNNGVFTLYNVTHVCALDRVETGRNGNFLGGFSVQPIGFSLGDIAPGDYKSLSCENVVRGATGGASIRIKITYARWPFIHHLLNKSYPFRSVQADDGTWIWKK
jgi:hypothetical protein